MKSLAIFMILIIGLNATTFLSRNLARKGDGSKPAMSKEDMMKKKGSGKAKFFATTSKGLLGSTTPQDLKKDGEKDGFSKKGDDESHDDEGKDFDMSKLMDMDEKEMEEHFKEEMKKMSPEELEKMSSMTEDDFAKMFEEEIKKEFKKAMKEEMPDMSDEDLEEMMEKMGQMMDDGEHHDMGDMDHPSEEEIRGALGKMGMSDEDMDKSHEKFLDLDEQTQGGVMNALGHLVEAQKGMDFEHMTEDEFKGFDESMKGMWREVTGDHDEKVFKHLFDHSDGEGDKDGQHEDGTHDKPEHHDDDHKNDGHDDMVGNWDHTDMMGDGMDKGEFDGTHSPTSYKFAKEGKVVEDDNDMGKKCKGDAKDHVMPESEIKMKKLMQKFGSTKQELCDAFRKIAKMKPEKQMKVFGALQAVYKEKGHLMDKKDAKQEDFWLAAMEMEKKVKEMVGDDGTFESLFEPKGSF